MCTSLDIQCNVGGEHTSKGGREVKGNDLIPATENTMKRTPITQEDLPKSNELTDNLTILCHIQQRLS